MWEGERFTHACTVFFALAAYAGAIRVTSGFSRKSIITNQHRVWKGISLVWLSKHRPPRRQHDEENRHGWII
jgi:hypothetical protein